MKICNKCKLELSDDKFRTIHDKRRENGYLYSSCRKCENDVKRASREKVRTNKIQTKINDGIYKQIIKPLDNLHKCCPYCGEIKLLEYFRHNRQKCHECEKKDGRNYRQSDTGKINSKQWVNNNKEYMAKLQSNWYETNKQKIRSKNTERIANDPVYKLKNDIKMYLGFTLKDSFKDEVNNKLHNDKDIIEYINCTIAFYIEWLKFNMTPEMTFANHGEYWQMDHVIPKNKFDLTDNKQIEFCYNWSNVSPIIKNINLSKHDEINIEQIKKHIIKLEKFVNLKELEYIDKIKTISIDNFHEKKYIIESDKQLKINDILILLKSKILCATHLVAGSS